MINKVAIVAVIASLGFPVATLWAAAGDAALVGSGSSVSPAAKKVHHIHHHKKVAAATSTTAAK